MHLVYYLLILLVKFLAQTPQDIVLCGLIAATNIVTNTGLDKWTCSSSGITSTNPCSPLWTGLVCSNGVVNSIVLSSKGIAGTIPSGLGEMNSLLHEYI